MTSQMLVHPADAVLLLPAQTRYEQRGGLQDPACGILDYNARVQVIPHLGAGEGP